MAARQPALAVREAIVTATATAVSQLREIRRRMPCNIRLATVNVPVSTFVPRLRSVSLCVAIC